MGPVGKEREKLAGAEWADLTQREQKATLAIVREKGRRAAEEQLGGSKAKPASLTALRRCVWAQALPEVRELPDAVFHRYLTALMIPCAGDYIELAVERFCPERGDWWGTELTERRADPRVCAFCAAFEGERCAILGLVPSPAAVADRQLALWQAKEEERERAREWLAAVETEDGNAAARATQQAVARFEYMRC